MNKGGKFNIEWHMANMMPKKPTIEDKIRWHKEHVKNCGCRPFPEELKKEMEKMEKAGKKKGR